MESIYRAIIAS